MTMTAGKHYRVCYTSFRSFIHVLRATACGEICFIQAIKDSPPEQRAMLFVTGARSANIDTHTD